MIVVQGSGLIVWLLILWVLYVLLFDTGEGGNDE